jgi:hypothetical protein
MGLRRLLKGKKGRGEKGGNVEIEIGGSVVSKRGKGKANCLIGGVS